jgi:hypothetical protein
MHQGGNSLNTRLFQLQRQNMSSKIPKQQGPSASAGIHTEVLKNGGNVFYQQLKTAAHT